MADSRHHVAILGGGIIGLSVAYFLLQRGHRVTVLERGGAAHDSCARGSAGMICPSHFIPLAAPGMVALGLKWILNSESPFYIKPRLNLDLVKWGWHFLRSATAAKVAAASVALRDLSLQSRKLYLEWATELGDIGLQQRGMLMLCETAHALEEESLTAAKARKLGIPAETLTAAQVAALDPKIEMQVEGGVYFPQDCHLDPVALLAALTRRVEELGGDVRYESEVKAFQRDGVRLRSVFTASGEMTADEFVLAGGVWSAALARDLGLSLPMQAGKGYSLTLPRPPAVAELCSILVEARVAVTPMAGGMRFGGTMEIVTPNAEINPRRIAGIVKSALRYFPQFNSTDFAAIPPWSGLRPCSPDGLPYLGRSERFANLIIATGHAMLGLSLAPATGAMVAQLIDGQSLAPSILFHPDRFANTLTPRYPQP